MKKIYIVEDESLTELLLRKNLEAQGFEIVGSSKSGEDALKRIPHAAPDLVLMDIYLNDELNGIEVAQQLASIFPVPIVYITASNDFETLNQAKITSPYGYLLKPFTEFDIAIALELALDKIAIDKVLRENEKKFRTILKVSTDFTFLTGADGTIYFASDLVYQFLDATEADIIDKNIIDVLPFVNPEKASKLLFSLKEGKTLSSSWNQIDIKQEGQTYSFEMSVSNYLEDKSIASLIVNLVDITSQVAYQSELERKNEALEKVNSELDGFVYKTSHDLRAPLASILGLVNISRLEEDSTQKNEYLKLIEKSVSKLDLFIQDIITFSKNTNTDLQISKINIEEVLDESFQKHKYLVGDEEFQFTYQIDKLNDRNLYSDVSRLSTICDNMISNAIKYKDYKKKRPSLHVQVSIDQSKATFKFQDNGLGIVESHLPYVFDMFYRATDRNAGSGLGLYIVKEMISKLLGLISIESQAGLGTIFTIEVPNNLPK
ncbi:MAG: response regulator [Cyclobacteriaceae bacterium]|nr:response regulator [Cyclobacteriaceae bacterium]MCH8515961.1 response regulator [Cyclobacteriaceae bacterium]